MILVFYNFAQKLSCDLVLKRCLRTAGLLRQLQHPQEPHRGLRGEGVRQPHGGVLRDPPRPDGRHLRPREGPRAVHRQQDLCKQLRRRVDHLQQRSHHKVSVAHHNVSMCSILLFYCTCLFGLIYFT